MCYMPSILEVLHWSLKTVGSKHRPTIDKHFEKYATNYVDNLFLDFDGAVSCVFGTVVIRSSWSLSPISTLNCNRAL